MSRRAAIILTVVLVLLIVAGGVGLFYTLRGARQPQIHLIPKGYTGWAEVRYGVKGAPPLPVEDGRLIFRYGPDGKLETSTEFPEGWAIDNYYYVDGDERTPLSQLPPGFDGRIWHAYSSFRTIVRTGDEVVRMGASSGFFVGTEEEYRNSDSHSVVPLPVPGG
jgi:hypothetical protein